MTKEQIAIYVTLMTVFVLFLWLVFSRLGEC